MSTILDRKDLAEMTSEFSDEAFMLSLLREKFQANLCEKYDQAIVNYQMREARIKLGWDRQHLGTYQKTRVRDLALKNLRLRYGPYVNLSLDVQGKFISNMNMIFKTDAGRMYQVVPKNILITTHALERLEERIPDLEQNQVLLNMGILLRKVVFSKPTVLDYASMLTAFSSEFGIPEGSDNLLYLNVGLGVFTVELHEMFGAVTTFLLHEKGINPATWYELKDCLMSYQIADGNILKDAEKIGTPARGLNLPVN